MRAALLGLCLLAAPAFAAESVVSTEDSPLTPTAVVREASGVNATFSLGAWQVFNGAPLAYTPFELGWAFENGVRLQTGIDLFYYEGDQESPKPAPEAPAVVERYSYEMMNWRTTLLYRVPMPLRLRPLAGISLEALQGTRRLAPTPKSVSSIDANATAPKIEAWGFLGVGALIGLEWMLNRYWSLQFSGRYIFTFGGLQAPLVLQSGLSVIF